VGGSHRPSWTDSAPRLMRTFWNVLALATVSQAAYVPKPPTGTSRSRPRSTATTPDGNARMPFEPPDTYLRSTLQELSMQTAERWRLHDDTLQRSIAELFEFEHQRAATFERMGAHPYWADPRIHNFGNLGWRGLVHALVVPIATHAIDRFAYSGTDARKLLHVSEFPASAEVVDLCAGVGFSSARNGRVTAVDTSAMMLAVARLRRPDVQRFEVGNAEEWGETDSCDIATVMYGMHEMPGDARRRVLRNALRLAREKVLVVDIWPGFEPSPMMLSGEPFVLDYLANIEDDIDACAALEAPTLEGSAQWEVSRVDVVDQHVRMWKFERIDWGI